MKKRFLLLVSIMIMFFGLSINANAEEDTDYIILYDFDFNTLGQNLGGAPTKHTNTRVYIEDNGQTIYPIYTDLSQYGDTYRPVAYFIVRDLACDLKLKKEVYNYETGETTVTESILNLNNSIPNYREIYNSNTNYYKYLGQFGFYPQNYDSLREGELYYKSFALLKAESYPTQYSTFTNYVDNDVIEFFFSDYSGDRKTSSSITLLSVTYQNSMNFYDFVPFLHEKSTVGLMDNPVPVSDPEPIPPEPEPGPEPEPLPPAGDPNTPPSGVDMNVSIQGLIEIVAKAWKVIVDNSVLMILFCSGLLGVAFRIIAQAKRTAKN